MEGQGKNEATSASHSPLEQPSGSVDQSITDAIDDALAHLQGVTAQYDAGSPWIGETALAHPTSQACNPSIESTDPESLDKALDAVHQVATMNLIDAMCRAPDRTASVEMISRSVCPPGTTGHVRIGIGSKQLKRLYDNRLGWLGNDISLFDRYRDDWLLDEGTSSADSSWQSIDFDQDKGNGRCRVWIHDDPAAFRWLGASMETISTVLWSRPRRAMPRVLQKLSQQSKVCIATGALVLLSVLVIPVPYRVACQAKVETVSQRYIAAPFEATLLEVHVRPGDNVTRGQSLVVLDGRPLRLELESLASELQRAEKERNVALATREISEAQKLVLKQRKLQRQMDLIEDRLANLRVVSPMDGVIVSGDLRKYIGSPLERGQTLVEVASMDKMAIEFEIPEHEISFITKGMEVRVHLDALGGGAIETIMDEIYPAAEIRDDRNVFIGRVEVDNASQNLRPGMQGDATAYGPLRPWIWSRTRGGFERLIWWIGLG